MHLRRILCKTGTAFKLVIPPLLIDECRYNAALETKDPRVMLNKFPLWKNLMILLIVTFGFIYASPNLFPPDPAIQLSGQSGAMVIDQPVLDQVEKSLDEAGIEYFAGEADGESLLVRLKISKCSCAPKRLFRLKWVATILLRSILRLPPRTG